MPPTVPHGESSGPLVLAVLGGVASGKSSAAKLLAGPDGRVIDADQLAHEVLESEEVTTLIRRHFGAEALDPNGRPDRSVLAERAFRDPEDRKRLEGWTHPRVRAMILTRLEQARAEGVPRVVLDVPLLLESEAESRLVDLCDALVFIDCDEEERSRRAAQRGWSPGELSRREAAQLPLSEKIRRADQVLLNQGSVPELEEAARELLRRLGAD